MMSTILWYECTDQNCYYVDWPEMQEKMGPYNYVGLRTDRDNTSIELPVYLNSKLVDDLALIITKCPDIDENETGMSRKRIRQWAGSVRICFFV